MRMLVELVVVICRWMLEICSEDRGIIGVYRGDCVGGRDMLCVVEQYLAVGICFGNALRG